MRIGLQVKSILVLAVVVLVTTASGGWLYYAITGNVLHQNDREQAEKLIRGLAIAAEPCLAKQDLVSLHKLVKDLGSLPSVRYVAVLDSGGKSLASEQKIIPNASNVHSYSQPSLSYDLQRPDGLEVGRPLVVKQNGQHVVAGGVRLIADTASTTAVLTRLHREMTVCAAAILVTLIPLGYLLVWRVMVVPVRKLLNATRRLAGGDFSVRIRSRRNDEIGELAISFDDMAEHLYESQCQLRAAKDSLERKVVERTGELETANRRLREEMAEKEDFLRAVSHDLGAPLRNIAGMATLITMKWRDQLPEEVLARLQRIQANVDMETGMIHELLELSRIKSQPESRTWVDFNALMQELADTFEYELKAKNVHLEVASRMPRLYVEKNRVRQVFQNLIDNAIKYVGERPNARVQVAYERRGEMHQFSVADNGPGIPPEDQERIFHVFRRSPSTATASIPGKGVGLAVVKTVVSNYEGRAWVESPPGGGSTFYVALSVSCTEGPPESANERAKRPELAAHPVGR